MGALKQAITRLLLELRGTVMLGRIVNGIGSLLAVMSVVISVGGIWEPAGFPVIALALLSLACLIVGDGVVTRRLIGRGSDGQRR